ADATDSRFSKSTGSQLTRSSGRGGVPSGRYHATTSWPADVNKSTKWLPAKPAAPVTRTVSFFIEAASARNAAERAVERRKVAEAGQGERQEEAVIRGNGRCAADAEVPRLVFEGDPAALRVVEVRHPLALHARVQHIVIER